MTAASEAAGAGNTISGGVFTAPVVQGRKIEATFQLPAAAPVALAQLPAEAAGFTGRDGELAVLERLLDPAGAEGSLLVSAVAGTPGVGKTALAVAAAHAARRRGWFAGGVLFLDLHGYDDNQVQPAQALDALLRALGVPAEHIPPSTGERAGLYRSVLAQIPEPVLVIADNASAETQVRVLLPGAGPHRMLVTSRHTLAGLGARLTDVTVLDPDAAVAVLEAALEVARPGEERITAHPEAAERLAAACGGLPLALQIVAAVLNADPALTAAELAGQFSDETQRLRALHYDDGSGGLSVASAFELSYRRLDDVSARVFRLLPVSPGPDLSTATAAVLVSLLEAEMRRVLGGLARAHLIETAPGAAGRWRMHDLLRLYAQQLSDQHADADGREQARDQLLDHYGAMADAADKHLRALPGTAVPGQFTGRDDAMAWLDTERISLTAAVSMAAETGRKQEAVYLSLLLAEHLKWRRRFDDWLAVTAIGLAAARHLGYRHGEAMALNNLGNALQQMRRFGEAVTACQDAAAIYRETGDRHGEAVALTVLGLALREVRRFDEAVTACRKAATIYRETGDRHGEGGALSNLGIALQKLRRFGEAVTACQDAAAIYRETGDRHGEAITLTNLGNTLTQMRRFEEAITVHQGAADIFRETQDRHGEAAALANLGSALLEGSQFADAVTACRTAAAICQETGDRHGEAVALNNLGIALRVLERFEEAITVHQGAADIFRETQDRHGEARARCHIGRAWQDAWQFDRAVAAFRDAAALFQEAGDNESERTTLKCIDEIGLARRLGRVVPRREHR